jgi:hypothetical protein
MKREDTSPKEIVKHLQRLQNGAILMCWTRSFLTRGSSEVVGI